MSQEPSISDHVGGTAVSRLRHDLLQAAEQIGGIKTAIENYDQIEQALAESRTALQNAQHLSESLLWAENSVAQIETAHADVQRELASTQAKAVKAEKAHGEVVVQLNSRLNQSQDSLSQLKSEHQALVATSEAMKQEYEEIQQTHKRLRRESSETERRLRLAVEQMETALATEHEGRAISEKELDAARLRISHLQARIEQADAAVDQQREQSQQQIENLNLRLQETNSKLQIAATNTQQEAEAKVRYDALELERDEFRLQVVALQKQLETVRSHSGSAASQAGQQKIQDLQNQLKQVQAELTETTLQLDRSQISLAELKRNQAAVDTNESVYVEALMQDAKSICDAAKAREEEALALAAEAKAENQRLIQELELARSQQESRAANVIDESTRADAPSAIQPSISPKDFRQHEKRRKIRGA